MSTRLEARSEDPRPYEVDKVAGSQPKTVGEMQARIKLLASEMDANDAENAEHQAEINRLYATIDALHAAVDASGLDAAAHQVCFTKEGN